MDPKSFNLYVGKLVNIKVLGNVCSKSMLLPIKNIIFFVNLWSNIMKYYYIVTVAETVFVIPAEGLVEKVEIASSLRSSQ